MTNVGPDSHRPPRQASHPERFRQSVRQRRTRHRQSDGGIDIRQLVIANTIGAFIGVIVGEVTKGYIFGE